MAGDVLTSRIPGPHGTPFRGQRVLVTGHTGFVGGWLCAALCELGAEVAGYALAPSPGPSFFVATRLSDRLRSTLADLRERDRLEGLVQSLDPQVVFHLAAQPLVRTAFAQPVETFSVNLMGSVYLLDALRHARSLRSVVVMTTDKVYRNREWPWPYRETDELGGSEPYSASKAACELAVTAYAESYLTQRGVGVATVRAGNILGGGDWAADRLIPDAVRAFRASQPLVLRNPHAVRPWQHVLEVVVALLRIAQALERDPREMAGAWNVGPAATDQVPVIDLAQRFATAWGDGVHIEVASNAVIPETNRLRLDASKADSRLGIAPLFGLDEAIQATAQWYRQAEAGADMAAISCAAVNNALIRASHRAPNP